MDSDYYVYGLLYEDGNPFYIGKGKGNRLREHFRTSRLKKNTFKNNVIKKIFKDGGKVCLHIFCRNLPESDALKKEIDLIKAYGRRDLNLGPLVNRTDGGDGVTKKIITQSQREKVSNSLKGKKKSAEHIEKLKATWSDPVTRAKRVSGISEATKGKKKVSEIQKEKIRKFHIGRKNSEDTKRKMSEAAKRRWMSV